MAIVSQRPVSIVVERREFSRVFARIEPALPPAIAEHLVHTPPNRDGVKAATRPLVIGPLINFF
jgi:hypothetical protein